MGRFANPTNGKPPYLFTVINNGKAAEGMLERYKGVSTGVSIPFYRKINSEVMKPDGGSSCSNNYGKYGELKSYFSSHSRGKEVRRVSDPQSLGSGVDEYNFGNGTENIKSLWNTGDFTPGGSPFAYIESLRDANYT